MQKKRKLLQPGDMVGRLEIKRVLTREELGKPPTKNGDHKYFYEIACTKCTHENIVGAESIIANSQDCPRCLVDDQYVGKKFNTLTVIRRHKTNLGSRNYYEALCTCGCSVIRNSGAFKDETAYCRKCTPRNKTDLWNKKDNLIGSVIGNLTILEFIDVIETTPTEPNRIYKCQINGTKKTIILPKNIINKKAKLDCNFDKIHLKKLSVKECNHIRSIYASKMYSFLKLRDSYAITITQLLNIIFNPNYKCD